MDSISYYARLAMVLALCLLALLVGGCGGWPVAYDQTRMTPEQLKAVARDKSATITCTRITYLLSTVVTVFINADMGKLDGSASVEGTDCSAKLDLAAPAQP